MTTKTHPVWIAVLWIYLWLTLEACCFAKFCLVYCSSCLFCLKNQTEARFSWVLSFRMISTRWSALWQLEWPVAEWSASLLPRRPTERGTGGMPPRQPSLSMTGRRSSQTHLPLHGFSASTTTKPQRHKTNSELSWCSGSLLLPPKSSHSSWVKRSSLIYFKITFAL